MKYFFIFIILINFFAMAQYKDFIDQLNSSYESFREPAINHRRFKHSDIKPLIENLRNNKIFSVKQVGVSAQNREIYLISVGTGPVKVFLWSQMHGDEPTATMAIFDLFNFFSRTGRFNHIKDDLLKKLTIYFMPMVNPDGAEVFERRNLYQIDLNRDAERLQTPEGKILKDTFDSLKADFGFNLHDQSIYYSAGKSFKSAAISFLAPATSYDKTITPGRYRAMQVIGQMAEVLEDFIPGHIGKYNDDFEPRAFGDNFQRWGTSTILIETGGWKEDPEKQFLRKLNFIILLASFRSIADKEYENQSIEIYENIPFNEKDNMMDMILRNLTLNVDGKNIIVDVGINRTELNTDSSGDFHLSGKVVDIGDLSVYSAYDDFDFNDMEISKGKTFNKPVTSPSELHNLDFINLLRHGYTNIICNLPVQNGFTGLPVNFVSDETQNSDIKVEDPANFYISKNGVIKYVVINGSLIEIENPHLENISGEVIR